MTTEREGEERYEERERILIPKAYKLSLSFSEDLRGIKLLQESKGKPLDLWNSFRP